ncbi:unnamed protein product [Arabidopsis halleri]
MKKIKSLLSLFLVCCCVYIILILAKLEIDWPKIFGYLVFSDVSRNSKSRQRWQGIWNIGLHGSRYAWPRTFSDIYSFGVLISGKVDKNLVAYVFNVLCSEHVEQA